MSRPILALLPLGLLWGCAYALAPVSSGIYGKVSGPVSATSNTGPATKTGRACANSVLGIVASGDASIEAAKRAGNITTVHTVDFESTNVLFLYASFCTVVHGN
jgi:TRL (tRNA-associated locus)-like protein